MLCNKSDTMLSYLKKSEKDRLESRQKDRKPDSSRRFKHPHSNYIFLDDAHSSAAGWHGLFVEKWSRSPSLIGRGDCNHIAITINTPSVSTWIFLHLDSFPKRCKISRFVSPPVPAELFAKTLDPSTNTSESMAKIAPDGDSHAVHTITLTQRKKRKIPGNAFSSSSTIKNFELCVRQTWDIDVIEMGLIVKR